MKTVEKIDAQINKIISETDKSRLTKAEVNAIKRQLEFLNFCRRLLETAPTKESLQRQLIDVRKKITSLDSLDKMKEWAGSVRINSNNYKGAYENAVGLTLLRKQQKTLVFLLEN